MNYPTETFEVIVRHPAPTGIPEDLLWVAVPLTLNLINFFVFKIVKLYFPRFGEWL